MTSPLLHVAEKGLYCPAGDFYIDPTRPVKRALITHAHSDHAREGHGEYFCSRPSVRLLHRRVGQEACVNGIPYGETFSLGGIKISFHPAGHILGSAQIRLEKDREVWVVSGDYKRGPDPSCHAFEVVPCDTFITEATFALPVYRWEEGHDIAKQIFRWWETNREEKRASVLFAYSLGKAQRVLAELMAFTDRKVYTHGAVEALNDCYREEGIALLPTEKVSEEKKDYTGELIIAPPSAQGSPWMRRFKEHETAFASGWMRVRGNRRRRGYDKGFALSDHADWPGLLDTVKESKAKRVLVTHGYVDHLVRYLKETGVDAGPLAVAWEEETE